MQVKSSLAASHLPLNLEIADPKKSDTKNDKVQKNPTIELIKNSFSLFGTNIRDSINSIKYDVERKLTKIVPQPLRDLFSTRLVLDPLMSMGKLKNGVTYYIQSNSHPFPDKAYVGIVLKVGSRDEKREKKQIGSSHLIEHITAHQTEKFPELMQIKKYFESKGVFWGLDNHAITMDNETLYYVNIGSHDEAHLEKTLFVFSEMAFKATLSDEIIEHEKEIILDELRLQRGAINRYHEQIFAELRYGSSGSFGACVDLEEEIKSTKELSPRTVREFYAEHYRPENLAVIAVGDFDKGKVKLLIEKYFSNSWSSKIQSSEFKVNSKVTEICKEPRFVCFSDPDIMLTQFEIYFKFRSSERTGSLYLKNITIGLINFLFKKMVNDRLRKKILEEAGPLLRIKASFSEPLSGLLCFHLEGVCREGRLYEGFESSLIEIERVKKYGFHESEFVEFKEELKASLGHRQKEKNSSQSIFDNAVEHFVEKTPLPNTKSFIVEQKKALEKLTIRDVNELAKRFFKDTTCLVGTFSPDKKTLEPISKDKLGQILKKVESVELTPFKADTVEISLMEELPIPGKIVQSQHYPKSNVTTLYLENGLKINIKPTQFQNDTIFIFAESAWGTRSVPVEEKFSAEFSDEILGKMCIGKRSLPELKKVLQKKNIIFNTSISSYLTTIQFVSDKNDIETAFQLFYLMFGEETYSKATFDKALADFAEFLRNLDKSSNSNFNSAVISLNTQNHPEFKPFTLEDIDKINFETATAFHKQSFSNPADFTVNIVGNVHIEKLLSLIEKYMASIPKKSEHKTRHPFSPLQFPKGIIHREFYNSNEALCRSQWSFPAPIADVQKDRQLASLSGWLLYTRLITVLRIQMGKTYTPNCQFAPTCLPGLNPENPSMFYIRLTCDPLNLDEINKAVLDEVKRLQLEGPSRQEIDDLKTTFKQQRCQILSSNLGWISILRTYNLWGINPDQFDEFDNNLESFAETDFQDMLKKIVPLDNYTRVVLLPKKESA